jgi:hypothetical protein
LIAAAEMAEWERAMLGDGITPFREIASSLRPSQ